MCLMGVKSRPILKSDMTNPQSVYGQSKWLGEEAIRAATPHHIILRTSWIFGMYGNNFLKTILRLAKERDSLSIVADQHGAPTSAALIADITAQILRHYARFRLATFIMARIIYVQAVKQRGVITRVLCYKRLKRNHSDLNCLRMRFSLFQRLPTRCQRRVLLIHG